MLISPPLMSLISISNNISEKHTIPSQFIKEVSYHLEVLSQNQLSKSLSPWLQLPPIHPGRQRVRIHPRQGGDSSINISRMPLWVLGGGNMEPDGEGQETHGGAGPPEAQTLWLPQDWPEGVRKRVWGPS